MTQKIDLLRALLPARLPAGAATTAYAPANIALAKYWGKRDTELNLPTNSSLSLSLGHLGTTTSIAPADNDTFTFNGKILPPDHPIAAKVWRFVALWRGEAQQALHITTSNSLPTAAGLASSASGFAALTLALNAFWRLDLPAERLSMIARFGSGSAARSLWHGFVKWERGTRADGWDSVAMPLATSWPALRFALVEVSHAPKAVASGAGMRHCAETSPLFAGWVETANRDVMAIERAIMAQDFVALGQCAEGNALAMHATMLAARPALSYFLPATLATLHTVWAQRALGLRIFATIDAGANVKILYLAEDESAVRALFPSALLLNPWQARPEA